MGRTRTASKQREILDAATRVFSAHEFHEVRVEDIAARAHIGKGTIYRYFDDKDDLFLTTIVRGYESLYEALAACPGAGASGARRLEHVAREILRFFWTRRHFYALLYRGERWVETERGRLKRTRARIASLVSEILADGVRSGEFARCDPRIGAELFLGMIRGANVFRRESDSMESLVEQILRTFLKGITKENTQCKCV